MFHVKHLSQSGSESSIRVNLYSSEVFRLASIRVILTDSGVFG